MVHTAVNFGTYIVTRIVSRLNYGFLLFILYIPVVRLKSTEIKRFKLSQIN